MSKHCPRCNCIMGEDMENGDRTCLNRECEWTDADEDLTGQDVREQGEQVGQ